MACEALFCHPWQNITVKDVYKRQDSLATVYLNEAWGGLWIDEQGNPLELKMIAPEDEAEAWFDKEHSLNPVRPSAS